MSILISSIFNIISIDMGFIHSIDIMSGDMFQVLVMGTET